MERDSDCAVGPVVHEGVLTRGRRDSKLGHERQRSHEAGQGGVPQPGAPIRRRHPLGAPGNTTER